MNARRRNRATRKANARYAAEWQRDHAAIDAREERRQERLREERAMREWDRDADLTGELDAIRRGARVLGAPVRVAGRVMLGALYLLD